MKKLSILVMMLAISIVFIGCQTAEGASVFTTTTDIEDEEIEAIFPSYDGFDQEMFAYANVHIVFNYDVPSNLTTMEEKRAYYSEKNQAYLEDSNLSSGQYNDIYISLYTQTVSLSYQSKRMFLEDFDLIKQGFVEGYYHAPNLYLNTVGKNYQISESSTLSELISVTDQYFGTEITYDLIAYNLLVNEPAIPIINEDKAYESYEAYLEDFSLNLYDIEEVLFDDYVLIVLNFGHSGSMRIQGIDQVFYMNDQTLQVAVKAEADSIIMTEDYLPRTIVITIPKDDYISQSTIQIDIHTKFLDGTYADRPFENTIDQ